MNINDRLLVKMAEEWLKIASDTSKQLGDYEKALAPVFNLIGNGAGDYTFDVNSKAANTIFELMDKFSYKGKVEIWVKISTSKQAEVIVKSMNQKLSQAVKDAFQKDVSEAIIPLTAPASDLVADKNGPFVSVQNTK